jgi:hypothetical protein
MTIAYLIEMAERRLAVLQTARANSEAAGDLAAVNDLAAQIVEAEGTLRKLRSLPA